MQAQNSPTSGRRLSTPISLPASGAPTVPPFPPFVTSLSNTSNPSHLSQEAAPLSRPYQKSLSRPARQNGGLFPKRDGRATRDGDACFARVNRSWPTPSCTCILGVTGANLSTRHLPRSTRLTSESSPGSWTRPRHSARSVSTAWRSPARSWVKRSAAGSGPRPPQALFDGSRTSTRRRASL